MHGLDLRVCMVHVLTYVRAWFIFTLTSMVNVFFFWVTFFFFFEKWLMLVGHLN